MNIKTKAYIILLILVTAIILTIPNNTEPITSNQNDNITVISGYWNVYSKFPPEKYNEWFKNTLAINQRYIFFCDPKDHERFKTFRDNYETVFIDYPMSDFYTNNLVTDFWNEHVNCPSNEVSKIWHEKMHLIKLSKDFDEETSDTTDFYVWIDSAIATYRDSPPPNVRLNLKDVNSLPHDKICYSSYHVANDNNIDGTNRDRDNLTAGCIIMYKDIIDEVHDLYYDMVSKCNTIHKPKQSSYCCQEQRVFTDLKDKYPDLFYRMCDGYGSNLPLLYEKYV
jgi:hypothetical protein